MAIDFTLTSYPRRLQRIAREFANEILAPLVRAADEDPDPQRAFLRFRARAPAEGAQKIGDVRNREISPGRSTGSYVRPRR